MFEEIKVFTIQSSLDGAQLLTEHPFTFDSVAHAMRTSYKPEKVSCVCGKHAEVEPECTTRSGRVLRIARCKCGKAWDLNGV